MKKCLLFITSNTNTTRLLLPLARELAGRDMATMFVSTDGLVGKDDNREFLTSSGVPVSSPDVFRKMYYGHSLAQKFRAIKDIKKAVKELIEEYCPVGIILGSDMPVAEKIFVAESKRRGIPSFLVQDGILTRRLSYIDILPNLPFYPVNIIKICLKKIVSFLPDGEYIFNRRWGSSLPDVIFVYSEYFKRQLASHYKDKVELHVSGSSKFVAPENYRYQRRKTDRPRILVVPSGLFSNYGEREGRKGLKGIELCCAGVRSRIPLSDIIVKIHPSENIKDYEGLLDKVPGITLIQKADMGALLLEADLLATFISTAGVEALNLGIPVIICNFHMSGYLKRTSFFTEINYPFTASDAKGLDKLLGLYLDGKLRFDISGHIAVPGKGNADKVMADRICSAVAI